MVVSNSSQDGASGVQHSSLATTREEIYRFASGIFSGNPNDRIYFLGEGVDCENELKRKYGGLKSCIHGSDAHCLEEVCIPCTKRGIRGGAILFIVLRGQAVGGGVRGSCSVGPGLRRRYDRVYVTGKEYITWALGCSKQKRNTPTVCDFVPNGPINILSDSLFSI